MSLAAAKVYPYAVKFYAEEASHGVRAAIAGGGREAIALVAAAMLA